MKKPIHLRPEAADEFNEAYHWYEERRGGLGANFQLCVEEAFERIQRDPESYPVVHQEVRQLLIRRFPYSVLYEVETDRIVVIAVFHGSRDPGQWQSRM